MSPASPPRPPPHFRWDRRGLGGKGSVSLSKWVRTPPALPSALAWSQSPQGLPPRAQPLPPLENQPELEPLPSLPPPQGRPVSTPFRASGLGLLLLQGSRAGSGPCSLYK